MNAGERNCYESLREHIENYGFDAAFVALTQAIKDADRPRAASLNMSVSSSWIRLATRHLRLARKAVGESGLTLTPDLMREAVE